jgi:hypothetical protein
MSELTTAPTVQKLIFDITTWWDGAVQWAKQEKDEVALARKILLIMQARDVEGYPFLWRDVKAENNSYAACRGTVLDVSNPRTEVHLPYRQLATALKTFIRLSEGHCIGMEVIWDRYGMTPPKPLTKEACLEWVQTCLTATPGIFQRAIAVAETGEGLLTVEKEVAL